MTDALDANVSQKNMRDVVIKMIIKDNAQKCNKVGKNVLNKSNGRNGIKCL